MVNKAPYLLLGLLSICLNNIQGMDNDSSLAYRGEEAQVPAIRYEWNWHQAQNPMDKLMLELVSSFNNEHFNEVANLVKKIKELGYDLNYVNSVNEPLFHYIYLDFLTKPSDLKLKVIEYLINSGLNLNITYFTPELDKKTPLESIIEYLADYESSCADKKLHFYFKFFYLLLNHGENITEKALKLANNGYSDNRILRWLNYHKKTINKAIVNPTRNLLFKAITCNRPYIVKLIAHAKPELVASTDIHVAEIMSPFSIEILEHALQIKKFRESELAQQLPIELRSIIEKFIIFKK